MDMQTPQDPQARKLQPPRTGDKLKAERVQEELKSMPGWRPTGKVRAIHRVMELPSHRLAHAYAGYVADAAAEAGQPAWVTLNGRQVEITLRSPGRNGGYGNLTESTLAFARRLG